MSIHELVQVPGRRLGLRPADPDRPVLKLADMLSGQTPDHPAAVDYLSKVTDFDLYMNDQFGVCGPAAYCNAMRLASLLLTGTETRPTQADVFNLYRQAGNPDFDENTGAGDNGVILADMLAAAVKNGVAGVKPVAYAKVDVRNLDEVRAAIAIFGFQLFGVDLHQAQQAQTDKRLWDYVRGSAEWGGHAVLGGAYTSTKSGPDVILETWAELVGTTDAFFTHQVQESWVLIFPWMLGTSQFLQGIDGARANAAYRALTGKPGPFPVTPGPKPIPPADDDETFAQQLRTWIEEAAQWLAARGL